MPELEGITSSQLDAPEEGKQISVEELGKKLEDFTESVLKSMGYITERNQRLLGKSGTRNEIDILAKSGSKVIAVECKNYANYVGVDQLREFNSKLEDLQMRDALFVTNAFFSRDAETYANHKNIRLWNGKQLQEHFFTASIGRLGSFQEITLSSALPVEMKYEEVCKIAIANPSAAKITRPRLILHPYYVLHYRLDAQRKDPARGMHRIQDEGIYVVDAVDGEIAKANPKDGLGSKLKDRLAGESEEAYAAREQRQVIKDLLEIKPQLQYKVQQTRNYDVTRLRYLVSFKSARWNVIHRIVDENTKEITYRIRVSRDNIATRKMAIIPKYYEVRIKKLSLVYVPKWIMDIESGQFTYSRRTLAASRSIIQDTISICPKHFSLGNLRIIKKATYAVCEICGGAFCADHITKAGDIYYCPEHVPGGLAAQDNDRNNASEGRNFKSLFRFKK